MKAAFVTGGAVVLAAMITASAMLFSGPAEIAFNPVIIVPDTNGQIDYAKVAISLHGDNTPPDAPRLLSVNVDALDSRSEKLHSGQTALLLIDRSGSMSVRPFAEAALEFAGRTQRREKIGVMAFSESAMVILPFGDHALVAVNEALKKSSPNGTLTDLLGATRTGVLALRATNSASMRMIIVSDFIEEPGTGQHSRHLNLWRVMKEIACEAPDINFELVVLGNMEPPADETGDQDCPIKVHRFVPE